MGQVKLEQIIAPNKASSEDESAGKTALVAIDTRNLNEESLDILNQIIAAESTDADKNRDLAQLFVTNMNKKTMVRLDSLNELQDNLVGLLSKRVTDRPDEISNQELMQAVKIIQDLIDRGAKTVTAAPERPVIQINTQTNNIGTELDGVPRESRDKVKNAVMSILSSINTTAASKDEIIDDIQDGEEDD